MVGKKESALQVNHEQTSYTQQLIAAHVDALVTVVEEMGSPFEKDGQDLLRLHSKDIMDKQSQSASTIY